MSYTWKQNATFNGSTSSNRWTWKHVATEYWEDNPNSDNYYLKNKSIVRITSYLGRNTSASHFGGVSTCRVDADKDVNGLYKSEQKTFSYPTNVGKDE